MSDDYYTQLRELQNTSDVYGLLEDKLKAKVWARMFLWLKLNQTRKKSFFSSDIMFDLNLINIDYINKILFAMVNVGLISKVGKVKQRVRYTILDEHLDDEFLISIAKKTLKVGGKENDKIKS